MGTWGCEPADNDGSGDLYYHVQDAWDEGGVKNAINVLYVKIKTDVPSYTEETQWKWELLGMLQLFLDNLKKHEIVSVFHKHELTPDALWTSHQFAQDCLNNAKWAYGWEDPEEMRTRLSFFKKEIQHHIALCCDT